jgi:hypothetical protein
MGCGGQKPVPTERGANDRPVLDALNVLNAYISKHNNQMPAKGEDVVAWVKTLDPAALAAVKVTDPDQAFVSPRDGQPYGINPAGNQMGPSMQVLLYEQVGVDGKHMTAGKIGNAKEMTADELRQFIPNLP